MTVCGEGHPGRVRAVRELVQGAVRHLPTVPPPFARHQCLLVLIAQDFDFATASRLRCKNALRTPRPIFAFIAAAIGFATRPCVVLPLALAPLPFERIVMALSMRPSSRASSLRLLFNVAITSFICLEPPLTFYRNALRIVGWSAEAYRSC